MQIEHKSTTVHRLKDFTLDELIEFVHDGGQVSKKYIKDGLIRSKEIYYTLLEKKLVSVMVIKNPLNDYKASIFDKAEMRHVVDEVTYEVGYVVTKHEHRRKGFARDLLNLLTHNFADNLFATVRADNEPAIKLLTLNRFVPIGKPFESAHSTHTIQLFLFKPRAMQTQEELILNQIDRALLEMSYLDENVNKIFKGVIDVVKQTQTDYFPARSYFNAVVGWLDGHSSGLRTMNYDEIVDALNKTTGYNPDFFDLNFNIAKFFKNNWDVFFVDAPDMELEFPRKRGVFKKLFQREDVPANNMGSGNIAFREPKLFGKKDMIKRKK